MQCEGKVYMVVVKKKNEILLRDDVGENSFVKFNRLGKKAEPTITNLEPLEKVLELLNNIRLLTKKL